MKSILRSPYLPVWPATLVLFGISPLVAPGSLGVGALQGMLPFAAILAVVAVGQTLVIQQRGLDLAVPGVVSLSAIVVTKVSGGSDGKLAGAIALALLVGAAAGLVSGIAVTRLSITPLVATLGVNALLLGTILSITGGSSTASASPSLSGFALGKVLGIPDLVIVAVLLTTLVALVVRRTTVGRRFVVTGTSAMAANAAGITVRRYQTSTYVVAGVMYAAGGILVAGYLKTPGLSAGNNYLLPSIAAVVLGGTSLVGGSGSVIATGAGALFLTQLQQVVFGAGAPESLQLIIQGSAIGVGMAVRTIPWHEWRLKLSPPPGTPHSRSLSA